MRILTALMALLTGCASVFDAPFENRTQALDEGLKHVEMERIDRLDAVVYVGHPMDVAWLCGQVGARVRVGESSSTRGCQFYVERDGLADPVVIVPRDDRTGEANAVVLAHERCHARGGTERDCR